MKLGRPREQEPAANYAEMTYESGFLPRRLAHRARFRAARELGHPPVGATVADFGCGDGRFALDLARERPDLTVIAWDPFPEHREEVRRNGAGEGVDVVVPDSLDELEPGTADVVFCLEVMEHLPIAVVQIESEAINGLLREGGALVVSVPVEVGPPALGKAVLHWVSGSGHDRLGAPEGNGSRIGEIARVTLGRPRRQIEREAADAVRGSYILSHAGFDHRRLLRLLNAEGWACESSGTSPFPFLPAAFNSQVLWRLRPSP